MPIDIDTVRLPATKGDLADIAILCASVTLTVSQIVDLLPDLGPELSDLDRDLVKYAKELDKKFNELTGWKDNAS